MISPRGAAHQGIRQTGDTLKTQSLMHNWSPKVCIDEQDSLPLLGKGDR
jgi:hypothetical protein